MTTAIDYSADTIDSRDLDERLTELNNQATDGDSLLDRDERNERMALQELADTVGDEWRDGVELVRESYFEQYARELADDLGAIPADVGWPCSCIDWERAARELAMDYSSVEVFGIAYLYR